MASVRPINVTIKGDYTDKDIKRAIKDLESLQKQAPKAAKSTQMLSTSFKGLALSFGAGAAIAGITSQIRAMAQAAAEDQQSVVALGKALSNVGLGAATNEAEAFVESLMLATGVADSDLRNSLQTLTTATGDFALSQRLVQVAMDASAATGRDLASVSLAIAKASQGNVGALTRMGIPLDANIVKAKDFNAALKVMEDRFSGQAAAAAETYAGKLQRVNMAVGEAQETIGYELLASLDAVSEALGGTDGAVSGIMGLGEEAAAAIRPVRELAQGLEDLGLSGDLVGATFGAIVNTLGGPVTSAWLRLGRQLQDNDEQQGAFAEHLSDIRQNLLDAAVDAGYLGRDYELLAEDTDTVARSTVKATTALERLQAQMDKMRTNRSIAGQRIGLAEMRSEGPGKGENVRKFGLDYADQASSLAFDIAERGNFSEKAKRRARGVLGNARDYLGDLGLGANFTSAAGAFLGTPDELRSGSLQQRVVGEQTGSKSTVINYNFAGDIVVQRTEQAIEEAKRLARLAATGRGPVAPARAVG